VFSLARAGGAILTFELGEGGGGGVIAGRGAVSVGGWAARPDCTGGAATRLVSAAFAGGRD